MSKVTFKCWRRCCVAKNKTPFQLSCIAMLLITCARAQIQYQANFVSYIDEHKNESVDASAKFKNDVSTYWDRTRQNIVNLEGVYDETVDEIRDGMRNERENRRMDSQEHEQNDPREVEQKHSFEARHETVVDREMPGAGAGREAPCSRGKVCARREESKEMMIETLKRNILMQLKLKEPPNITVPNNVLDSYPIRKMLKKYGIKSNPEPEPEPEEDADWVEDETKREKVISYARKLPFEGYPGSSFQINEEDTIHSVTSAVLWLYFRPNPRERKHLVHVEFFRYELNVTHPKAPPVAVKFDTQEARGIGKKGRWRNFSIAGEVRRWFLDPRSNLGIYVRIPALPDIIVSTPIKGEEDLKPLLEIDLGHNQYSRRRRRDLGNWICNENGHDTRCCKNPFEINFENLGWNWIINPKVYKSHYCSGDCTLMLIQSNQNRIIAMQDIELPGDNITPCCAPTKMSPISLLYFDNENTIIYSEVPDMLVNRCGCV